MRARLTFRLPALLFLVMLIASSFSCQQPAATHTPASRLRVMTFNIRYNNPNDGEHAWPNRKARVASTILFNGADLVGVQEALKEQMDDLASLLPGYAWIGVGRDDGQEAGEYSAIIYNQERLEVLDSGTFWLSTTPEVPGSKDWDAAITRIATWGQFKDHQTGATFYQFNTHFDHRGVEARKHSAAMIADRATQTAGDLPLVVTGDFNFTEEAEGYPLLTEKLNDTFYSSEQPHHGPEATFYGFEVSGEPGRRIDYIFVNDNFRVLQHATLSDNWEGAFASDHLAVVTTLQPGTAP